MKPLLITILAASMCLSASAGIAKNNDKGNSNKGANKAANSCPPGLAKKNPPCVPPGQAKKYGYGDRLTDYVTIENPGRYGLPANGYYVRAGNYVYRIDQNTQEVLNLVGAVIDILN